MRAQGPSLHTPNVSRKIIMYDISLPIDTDIRVSGAWRDKNWITCIDFAPIFEKVDHFNLNFKLE
jgi:hypothetical protein